MVYNRFEDPKHIRWAKEVKKKDGFKCRVCLATNTYLHSHHKNSFDIFIHQRFDVNNGVTLCSSCHERFHNIYGSGKNTEYQFEEFLKIVSLIRELVKKG